MCWFPWTREEKNKRNARKFGIISTSHRFNTIRISSFDQWWIHASLNYVCISQFNHSIHSMRCGIYKCFSMLNICKWVCLGSNLYTSQTTINLQENKNKPIFITHWDQKRHQWVTPLIMWLMILWHIWQWRDTCVIFNITFLGEERDKNKRQQQTFHKHTQNILFLLFYLQKQFWFTFFESMRILANS